MWIGTFADGVLKYDGSNFTNYTTKNSALSNDSISCLYIDAEDDVYIGTQQGLNVFSSNKITCPAEINKAIGKGIVNSVCVDRNDCLWLGVIDRKQVGSGIYVFHNDTIEFYNDQNSALPNNLINTIVCGKDGKVWIGTNQIGGKGGLVSIQNNQWQVYTKNNSALPYNCVEKIVPMADSSIITASRMLFYDDATKMHGYVYQLENLDHWTDLSPGNSNPVVSNRITSIAVSSEGILVAATSLDAHIPDDRYDLSVYRYKQWITFDALGYPIENFIPDMAFDAAGNLWVLIPDNREMLKISNFLD